MISPLITVAIPVYNREKLVVRAIESALAQTYPNIEIVVVDNCSTDGTYETLLRNYEHHCRIFRNDENIGPVANWLKCIQLSAGDYVKILFSDDWLEPSAVALLFEPFQANPCLGFSYSTVVLHMADRVPQVAYSGFGGGIISSMDFLWHHCTTGSVPVSPCAALFRRKDLVDFFCSHIPCSTIIDGNRYGAGNDAMLYWRACERYPSIYRVNKSVVHFADNNLGEPSITTQYNVHGELDDCYKNAFLYFLGTCNLPEQDVRVLRGASLLMGFNAVSRCGKLMQWGKEIFRGGAAVCDLRIISLLLRLCRATVTTSRHTLC